MTTLPATQVGVGASRTGVGRGRARRRGTDGLSSFAYVAPTWVFMLAVGVVPIGYAVWISVSNLSLANDGSQFVGFANYARAVFTPRFAETLGVTVFFVLAGLVIQFVIGYLLAVALHRQLRGYQIARTFLLIPMLLTPVVVGLIWQFMFNPDLGVITGVLHAVGIDLNAFADPILARGLILFIDAWMYIPFVMLMLVAGMTGVPEEPLEAAALDGAGWWQTTRFVVLPILAPVIAVTLIVRFIDTARMFDVIYTTTQGGPGVSTETVSLLGYTTTFQFYQFADGAAMSVALAVLMFPVYFIYIRLTRV